MDHLSFTSLFPSPPPPSPPPPPLSPSPPPSLLPLPPVSPPPPPRASSSPPPAPPFPPPSVFQFWVRGGKSYKARLHEDAISRTFLISLAPHTHAFPCLPFCCLLTSFIQPFSLTSLGRWLSYSSLPPPFFSFLYRNVSLSWLFFLAPPLCLNHPFLLLKPVG